MKSRLIRPARVGVLTVLTAVACGGRVDGGASDGGAGGAVAAGGSAGFGGASGGVGGGASTGGGGATGGGGGATGGGGGGGATGGFGGVGGDPDPIGRACNAQYHCEAGTFCLLPNSTDLEGGGPPNGMCTIDCTNDASLCAPWGDVCVPFGPKSFCIESCWFGPTGLKQFYPGKCHGRAEVACSPLYDTQGAFASSVCLPTCNSDANCGIGLFCDPKTRFCKTAISSGLGVGAACTFGKTPDDCAGQCTVAGNVNTKAFVCTEACTVGAIPQCGWNGPGTPAPAFCFHDIEAVKQNGGVGVGDRAECWPLCDCDADCGQPALRCAPFSSTDLQGATQRKGYCAVNVTGIPSCS